VAVLDESDERLIKVVGIASGLGSSSAYTWLKIPTTNRMAEVAGATSMPILMLGGDPGKDTAQTFERWENAMNETNVRGLLAGRTLLYPNVGSVEEAIRQAAELVHGVNR
jgi:DhnA family fructose-bisphosphate aldolase class Ia